MTNWHTNPISAMQTWYDFIVDRLRLLTLWWVAVDFRHHIPLEFTVGSGMHTTAMSDVWRNPSGIHRFLWRKSTASVMLPSVFLWQCSSVNKFSWPRPNADVVASHLWSEGDRRCLLRAKRCCRRVIGLIIRCRLRCDASRTLTRLQLVNNSLAARSTYLFLFSTSVWALSILSQ